MLPSASLKIIHQMNVATEPQFVSHSTFSSLPTRLYTQYAILTHSNHSVSQSLSHSDIVAADHDNNLLETLAHFCGRRCHWLIK